MLETLAVGSPLYAALQDSCKASSQNHQKYDESEQPGVQGAPTVKRAAMRFEQTVSPAFQSHTMMVLSEAPVTRTEGSPVASALSTLLSNHSCHLQEGQAMSKAH